MRSLRTRIAELDTQVEGKDHQINDLTREVALLKDMPSEGTKLKAATPERVRSRQRSLSAVSDCQRMGSRISPPLEAEESTLRSAKEPLLRVTPGKAPTVESKSGWLVAKKMLDEEIRVWIESLRGMRKKLRDGIHRCQSSCEPGGNRKDTPSGARNGASRERDDARAVRARPSSLPTPSLDSEGEELGGWRVAKGRRRRGEPSASLTAPPLASARSESESCAPPRRPIDVGKSGALRGLPQS